MWAKIKAKLWSKTGKLVLVILAAMIVVPANAMSVGDNVTDLEELCPCGCGKTKHRVKDYGMV